MHLPSSRPIFDALLGTAASLTAFAMLRAIGLSGDLSLVSSMVLAGLISIRRAASLNCDGLRLTCEPPVGELSR
jgi:hypothetical protein